MLAKANGTREVCAANLIKTIRGECPYERTKGIDRSIIDAPSIDVNLVKSDVSWVLKTYEPRISQHRVTLTADGAEQGQFDINIRVG